EHGRAVKQHLDVLDGERTDDGGRQERDDEIAHERKLDRIACERTPKQMQQAFAEDPHHCQNRAELDHHLEHLVVTRGKVDPGTDEQQMRRAGYGYEFRETLYQPQKQGLEHEPSGFGHSFFVSWVSVSAAGLRSIRTVAMRRPCMRSTVNTYSTSPSACSHWSPASGRWPKRSSMKPATVE